MIPSQRGGPWPPPRRPPAPVKAAWWVLAVTGWTMIGVSVALLAWVWLRDGVLRWCCTLIILLWAAVLVASWTSHERDD